MKIVLLTGGPSAMSSYPHHDIKTVEGMYPYAIDERGVKGPFAHLNNSLITIMLSSLSENVPELRRINGVGSSTIVRLLKGAKVSDACLTSIIDFLAGWSEVLGAPRSLFDDGADGICGREGCESPAITIIGFSAPRFASEHCVPVEGEVIAVCGQHKMEFFDCAFQHKKYQGEVATLKDDLATLEAQVDSLGEENRSLEAELSALGRNYIFVRKGAWRRQRGQQPRLAAQQAANTQQPVTAHRATNTQQQIAAKRAATLAAKVEMQQWEELEQTDSDEARRVMEECEKMFSGLEL